MKHVLRPFWIIVLLFKMMSAIGQEDSTKKSPISIDSMIIENGKGEPITVKYITDKRDSIGANTLINMIDTAVSYAKSNCLHITSFSPYKDNLITLVKLKKPKSKSAFDNFFSDDTSGNNYYFIPLDFYGDDKNGKYEGATIYCYFDKQFKPTKYSISVLDANPK